jgi:hypothetical protein
MNEILVSAVTFAAKQVIINRIKEVSPVEGDIEYKHPKYNMLCFRFPKFPFL